MAGTGNKKNYFTNLLHIFFCAGIVAYITAIVYFNFNGSVFFIFDVYSDALVAKYMADGATLFPENWVFGNQYYVVSTSVIAAILYNVFHNSVISIAAASCIMTALILISFIWCCKPFLSRKGIAVGVFCLIGAVVIGDGICTYKEGLMYLYTMASFYACYVVCFLFTIGAYYRLKSGIKIPAVSYIAILLLNIALGMQSPRQMLIMNIPLIIFESICAFVSRKDMSGAVFSRKSLKFVLIAFICNLLGMWIISFFDINTKHLISDPAFVSSVPEFMHKLRFALDNLAAINGLLFLQRGVKYLPLGIASLFIVCTIVFVFLRIIVRKDYSVISQMFLLTLLSVACVFGVGVLLFVAESRYFFIRHIAAAFAFACVAENLPDNFFKKAVLTVLLGAGFVNLFYNAYPDYKKLKPLQELYSQVADDLVSMGKDLVLVDSLTHPSVAACSDDKLVCATFYPEYTHFGETGVLFESVVFLRPNDILDDIDPERTAILFAEYNDIYMPSFFDDLRDNAPEGYAEMFSEKLSLEKTYSHDLLDIHIYSFDDAGIIK